MVVNLGEQHSIFNSFIGELRDKKVQLDSMRFRRNLERIGEVAAYELSKHLSYEEEIVETPLGVSKVDKPVSSPVIASILRAALPMHNGLLNYFDKAENAFISAYRKHTGENTFEIIVEYAACPPLQGKVLVLCDPMLATGRSMIMCYEELLKNGTPSQVHIVSAIASEEGVQYITNKLPEAFVWAGAVDKELTPKSYISPGLGDAGDLAFGIKTT